MAVNIMTEPKFGKSNAIASELFTTKNLALDKKLNDFRENLEWFAKNKEDLRKEHGGHYIAVYENKICLTDEDPVKLLNSVKIKYTDDPSVMVTFIGKEKIKFLL